MGEQNGAVSTFSLLYQSWAWSWVWASFSVLHFSHLYCRKMARVPPQRVAGSTKWYKMLRTVLGWYVVNGIVVTIIIIIMTRLSPKVVVWASVSITSECFQMHGYFKEIWFPALALCSILSSTAGTHQKLTISVWLFRQEPQQFLLNKSSNTADKCPRTSPARTQPGLVSHFSRFLWTSSNNEGFLCLLTSTFALAKM